MVLDPNKALAKPHSKTHHSTPYSASNTSFVTMPSENLNQSEDGYKHAGDASKSFVREKRNQSVIGRRESSH